jgi:hypothetical protein
VKFGPRVTWFSFENVDMFVGHENCRTKTSFIYTVENIEASYIVFFSAIITSAICLLKVLKFLKFWNLEFFENFDLFLQLYWPTGNEISSLVEQRWNNIETPNRPAEAHARWTHFEVQPRKYCLGQSANSKIPYHLIKTINKW